MQLYAVEEKIPSLTASMEETKATAKKQHPRKVTASHFHLLTSKTFEQLGRMGALSGNVFFHFPCGNIQDVQFPLQTTF